jgi:hypothetical protein
MEEINEAICKAIQNGVQNDEIVKTINLLGSFLNAETIAAYGKRKGKDYTGAKYLIAKNNLKTFELFGVKFVVDNE